MPEPRNTKPDRNSRNAMTAAVRSVRNLFYLKDDWYYRPLTAALLTITVFFGGSAAGIAFEKEVASLFWPDPAAQKVEELQSQITEKTTTIDRTLQSMDGTLDEIEAESPAAKNFVQKAKTLRDELEGLKPTLSRVSTEASRLSTNLMQAKARQIEQDGASHIADFSLRLHQSITLCKQKFTAGYHDYFGNGDAIIYLSDGSENKSKRLGAGHALSAKSGNTEVSVHFRGYDNEGDVARFDFQCQPAEA